MDYNIGFFMQNGIIYLAQKVGEDQVAVLAEVGPATSDMCQHMIDALTNMKTNLQQQEGPRTLH